MKVTPIGDRILLKPIKAQEEKTKSGLYLPKSTQEKKEGEVVAVGTSKEGNSLPLQKGDRVIYSGYSPEEIEINGEKHIIIELKDVIAKIEQNDR